MHHRRALSGLAVVLFSGPALNPKQVIRAEPARDQGNSPAPVSARDMLERQGLLRGFRTRLVAFASPWDAMTPGAQLLVGDMPMKRKKPAGSPPGPRRIPDYAPQDPLGLAIDGDGPDFGFEGVPGTGWVPADAGIAAGPGHIVAVVNGQVAFFTKSGSNIYRRALAGAMGFWAELGAGGYIFDPEVHFDVSAGRFWVVACEQTGSAGYFDLAVSDDADPLGVWHKYRLDVSGLAGTDIDSPNMAITASTVYLTADFAAGGQRMLVYALPKAPLMSGSAPGPSARATLPGLKAAGLPLALDAGTEAQYMLAATDSATGSASLQLWGLQVSGSAVSTIPHTVPVPMYFPPGSPPQLGTGMCPNLYGARIWHSVQRGGSLWAAHHIRLPGSVRTTVRWYQIDLRGWPGSGTPPALRQSGDIDAGAGIHTFCPSIAADAGGGAAVTFARSSEAEHISIRRAVRRAQDPLGTLRAAVLVKQSTAPFTIMDRWGDYSTTVADPLEPCTFWGHHQFTTSSSDWRTWIVRYQDKARADFDNSCTLNIQDFNTYVQVYATGAPRADMNRDGTLNVLDFGAFLEAYAAAE